MKSLPLKHARRRISVARDENGVPHISATSWRGALYGLGYLHAIDRPTQLLFARAMASGRSAEQIADKPELLETDRLFRRVGLYLSLDREVDQLDDGTFDQLTAYCEGVNDGLKDAGRSWPMWATGFVPTPWTQQAVLLVGNLLSYGGLVVSQQENERILLELIQAGVEDDKMRELFSPLLDNDRFRSAAQCADPPPALRRGAGIAHRFAPAGRQQRLGRQPAAQRDRLGPVGLRSAPGGQPPAGHLVRGRAALGPAGRTLGAGGHATRLSAVCRRPNGAAGLGSHVSQRRYERLFHRRLPAGRVVRAGNIGAATAGGTSIGAAKRFSAKDMKPKSSMSITTPRARSKPTPTPR